MTTPNGNGVWRWIAATAVGALLALGGTVAGRCLSNQDTNQRLGELTNELVQLQAIISGPGGYGPQVTELRNELRDINRELVELKKEER